MSGTDPSRAQDWQRRLSRGASHVLTPLLSVVAALLVSAIILALMGADVSTALSAMINGALGSRNGIGTTLVKTCPLILAGAGICFALRARLFNIGAEGQIYFGALATTWVVLATSVSGTFGLVVGLVAGAGGGALWGAFAGWLKAKRGVNEVITTLLLNYVAIQIVLWAVSGPMKASGATFPRSDDLPDSVLLPPLIPGTQAHMGIIFGIVLTLVFAWVLRNSVFGYRMRALQGGTGTPLYAGFRVERLTIAVLAVSGAAAGLAGAAEILGVQHHLVNGFSPGYGFDALAVALLSRGNPLAVIPTALFFGILRSGANAMQRATGIPSSMVFVIQGIAVLLVISGYALEAIARKRRSARAALNRVAASPAVQGG